MNVLKNAELSECGTYRYLLARQWDQQAPALGFLMLNPSTADASVDDPTIRRCMAFARRDGYGGIIVANLFALRSTDPKLLGKHPDPVGRENDAWIGQLRATCTTVVAAWGGNPTHVRAHEVRALFGEHALSCLGVTKEGHPRHPLYVRGDQPIVPFSR